MRIYAAADIHGKKKHIDTIYNVIQKKEPDILIIPGDITHCFNSARAIDALKEITIPVFAIRGNWDFKAVEKIIGKTQNIHLITPNPMTVNGFELVGTGGTLSLPFLSKVRLNETQVLDQLAENINPHSILVVHPPPRGILDQVGSRFSAGSFGLRRLIESHPPRMVLCGHIHEESGYEYFGDTLVVNCAMNKSCGGMIIDYNDTNPPKVETIIN